MENGIATKITFENEVRRITIPLNSSCSVLRTTLHNIFGPSLPENFIIKYLDDDSDRITITSDLELLEAIEFFKRQSRPLLRLHLFTRDNIYSPIFIKTEYLTKESLKFLADVTIPDGSEIPSGTTFSKTWKVLNDGNVPWNTGYCLSWLNGDSLSSTQHFPLAAQVNPNEEFHLQIPLTASDTPGRFFSSFRLTNPHGQYFGDRLWVDFRVVVSPVQENLHEQVVEQKEELKQQPEEEEDEFTLLGSINEALSNEEFTNFSNSTFEEDCELPNSIELQSQEVTLVDPFASPQPPVFLPAAWQPVRPVGDNYEPLLIQLAEMGFYDEPKNDKLLRKHKGDITRTIRELLHNARK